MFEGNNQGFILGEKKTVDSTSKIYKRKNLSINGGICSPTVIHFIGFLYKERENLFGFNKGENYY